MKSHPVFITAYHRHAHLRQCVESLARSDCAPSTPLYIAIDGPSCDEHVIDNKRVLNYAKSIKGFKYVEVFERCENIGAFENARQGWLDVFSRHEAVIRTEDDNVFSPHFLRYVNEGLVRYKDCPQIFSICGYAEPLSGTITDSDGIYLRRGFSSFGFGIWRDRYFGVDLSAKDLCERFVNPIRLRMFLKSVGENIFVGLMVARRRGVIYSDMSIIYHIYKNSMYSVHPLESLVRNVGQDGTGLRSGVNHMLQNQSINTKILSYPIELKTESVVLRRELNKYHKQPTMVLLKAYAYYCLSCAFPEVFAKTGRA